MTETRFRISVPRFQRSPIDTSVFYRMTVPVNPQVNVIKSLRKIITNITGIDPYIDQKHRGSRRVQSRQLFLYFVRKYTRLTQEETGRLVGKNHATVVHAEKCVEKFVFLENDYKSIHSKIREELDRNNVKPLL